MTTLAEVLGGNDQFQTSGTLTKLLQLGTAVEEDDGLFELEDRKEGGGAQLKFNENNIDFDEKGIRLNPHPEINDGRRMPSIEEVLDDDDFIAELKSNNELLLKYLGKPKIVIMI